MLSTLRQAADLDFGLTVLADGCLDADPEVHRVLTEKVFPRQADVLTVGEWTHGPHHVRRAGRRVSGAESPERSEWYPDQSSDTQ